MENPLVDWFRSFRSRRAAIKMAVVYFEKTKMLKAHRRNSKVIAEEDGGYTVRVCYGHTKLPRRAWIIVNVPKSTIKEVSFNSVRQYGEGPQG
jgi:hypothetical protein